MTITRGRVWKLFVPLNLALLGYVLFFAGLRAARPGTVFYYTEGPVLGSLAALEATGELSSLYPADGWTEPPVVLTLYPPLYFVAAAEVDRRLGSEGTFLGLRIVSLLAFAGVLGLLAYHAVRRRASGAWLLAVGGAALMTPALFRLAGGAQADMLALFLTWVGLTAAVDHEDGSVRRGPLPLTLAAAAFLFAFLSKQSFVAAPAALVLTLALRGRVQAALAFALPLAAAALAAVFLLDGLTGGGYLANTLGALTGDASFANLRATLAESEPLQWLPVVVAVLLAVRGHMRFGLPEIYLLGSAALHTTAMVKTGSSVNYLLEPTFALLFLAVLRGSPDASANRGASAPRWMGISWNPALIVALALALPAVAAVWRSAPNVRALAGAAGTAQVAEFAGHPLVAPLFFPAVLARGGRPWLNDPFAFGAMEETGKWNPARLVEDLEERRIPFALSTVDPAYGQAPPGEGSRELVLGYFWMSPPVWQALNGAYTASVSGPLTAWLPREDESQ
ncbi:MAG: hypothetical protein M8866_07195 [marine benthic group bacterium]|nr:hypothetical protein [Candidatus Benthicola marisminoris]